MENSQSDPFGLVPPGKFTESAHQYSREFTRQYLDQNVAEGIDPRYQPVVDNGRQDLNYGTLRAGIPPADSTSGSWHDGALAEAKARDEGLNPVARDVRNYIEAIAKSKPNITGRELALSIARVYAPRLLRKKFRIDIPKTGSHR